LVAYAYFTAVLFFEAKATTAKILSFVMGYSIA